TSPGGALADGLMIGLDVAALDIPVVVVGECFSACAYLWLASNERAIWKSNAYEEVLVGIHMPAPASDLGTDVAIPEWITNKVVFYLETIGMTEAIITDIVGTPNGKNLLIGPAKASEWGI